MLFEKSKDTHQNLSEDIFEKNIELSIPNNQVNPEKAEKIYGKVVLSTVLRSTPQFIVCPKCKEIVAVRTERQISLKNMIFCAFFPLIWGVCQIFHNKDLNCYDAKHYCSKCNFHLVNYSAC